MEINNRTKKAKHLLGYLLGLVAETASLVRARGPSDAHDRWMLTVLPAPHPLQEAHHIRLLLPP